MVQLSCHPPSLGCLVPFGYYQAPLPNHPICCPGPPSDGLSTLAPLSGPTNGGGMKDPCLEYGPVTSGRNHSTGGGSN